MLAGLTFAVVGTPSSAYAQAPDKEFTIAVGETLTFNARGVTRVTIGLEKVANVKPTRDQKQLILTGLAPGVTTINLFSDRGQKTLLIRVVGVNPESLATEVREVLGERSGVDVRVVKGRVLLEGEVASEIFKQKIEKLVALYPDQVLNFTQFREAFVEGARMVALDMYFIQLAVRDNDRAGLHWGQFLGANFSYGVGDVPLYYDDAPWGHGVNKGESDPARQPDVLGLTGGSGTGYWSVVGNLNLVIDLIELHGLIKEIKHSVVVTETGTEAEYHFGGTLLIALEGLEGAFVEKEYGMIVTVKPVLDFENRVKLEMDIDISELDKANGVGDVPALRNSKVKATVNMLEGQSVLVSSQTNTLDTSNEQGFWLLSRIPILGWLFKGRSFEGTETNNALFVTPRIYEPGGKVHNTLINGAFERLLDAGAKSDDIPELGNAQAASTTSRPARAPAKSPSKSDEDEDGGDESKE
jgi:Flp pilus assembly secretin CpaC